MVDRLSDSAAHSTPNRAQTNKGERSVGHLREWSRRILCLLVMCAVAVPAVGQKKALRSANGTPPPGEWHHYGGDRGSTKYSPLAQITKDNVKDLKVAWKWDSPDLKLQAGNRALSAFGFEVTPLMVKGVLYTSTSLSQVAAINALTGETVWVFDPESYKAGRPTNLVFVHRGVAYWTDGREERILIGTADAYLIALDAKTGTPIPTFGEAGRVNLAKAIPLAVNSRNYAVTSPPVICRDVVVVGSSISDGPSVKEAPRGDIQAFDVRTGKPLWVFHTVPQAGEFGVETWENDSWKYTGNTNVWTLMSADEELGYFYLPTGTPTNDWYGGHRLGNNLFAESLLCLDAKTGKRIWHFQSVHHGVWDYDFPAAPILANITVGGRRIRAVVQLTKTGFTWVFDRVTGKPVWPIEERPVPASKVPGERLSPTQPFPTKPAPFELQGSTEDNLINFTPELREEAKKILAQYDHGPIFEPPTERGTINLPGWGGGANWWGASVDPETNILYIPSISSPIVVKLVKPDGARSNFTYVRGGGGLGGGVEGPKGLPLFKPPYGRITAIDLNTGQHKWMVPNGDGARKRINEIIGNGIDVGPVGAGGSGTLATKTLLFVGQGASGRGGAGRDGAHVLRAFDKATGKVVAEITVPGVPNGTPMTYLAGGKQFIVLATSDGRLVALSL